MRSGFVVALALSLVNLAAYAAEPAPKGYVVAVDFGSAPENFGKLKELMLTNAAASVSNEAGCRQLDVYELPASPNHLFLYEVYDSETASKTHLEAPHYKRFVVATASIITS